MQDTQNSKSPITSDVIAGLTASIPSVPDAMASGVLAGISPIYGLYGLMIGTPVAAFFTGSAFFRQVTQANAMPPQDPALWRAHGMELLGPPLPVE